MNLLEKWLRLEVLGLVSALQTKNIILIPLAEKHLVDSAFKMTGVKFPARFLITMFSALSDHAGLCAELAGGTLFVLVKNSLSIGMATIVTDVNQNDVFSDLREHDMLEVSTAHAGASIETIRELAKATSTVNSINPSALQQLFTPKLIEQMLEMHNLVPSGSNERDCQSLALAFQWETLGNSPPFSEDASDHVDFNVDINDVDVDSILGDEDYGHSYDQDLEDILSEQSLDFAIDREL